MDEFEKLEKALRAAPAPSQAARDAAMRAAEENFDRLQETGGFTRPTETAPQRGGFLKGLKTMFAPNSLKPLMLTTSSLVVVGVGLVLVTTTDFRAPYLDETGIATDEPLILEVDEFPPVPLEDHNDEGALLEPIIEDMLIEEPIIEAPVIVAPQPNLRLQSAPSPSALADNASRSLSKSANGATFQAEGVIRPAPTLPEVAEVAPPANDRFANEAPNPVKITSEESVSTFSSDVDTASYAWVRQAIMSGRLPSPDQVRVEEMINYFSYGYPAPEGDAPFSTSVTVAETPWNADTQLVHIGIQGEMPATADRPPLNLVFLIDTSGSMQSADKLPLLVQSFRLMLSELRPEDQVAIVTYAGSAGTALPPTAASERNKIEAALSALTAGGSTAGEAGLRQAYALAEQMSEEGEIGRVILATDGDFNVGMSSDDEMKRFIEARRDSGTYLSVLGFGRGNLNDALMQTLAQNGNGQAAYIDTLSEARKVLVDQLTGALFPIAGDVKLQVEWNPAEVAEYRLIGYETRALRREDFNNDQVDAGDIGAGHSVTAIYEVTPVGSPAVLNDALRYGAATATSESDELGFLRLRYKEPGETASKLIETPITPTRADAPEAAGFASAIAGFGQLLRGSTYLGDWGYQDAIALANAHKGEDLFGYRAEALSLMRLADSLSR